MHRTTPNPLRSLDTDDLHARATSLRMKRDAFPQASEQGQQHARELSKVEAELQRRRDDERALAENDEQRDYAEERHNARLCEEV